MLSHMIRGKINIALTEQILPQSTSSAKIIVIYYRILDMHQLYSTVYRGNS